LADKPWLKVLLANLLWKKYCTLTKKIWLISQANMTTICRGSPKFAFAYCGRVAAAHCRVSNVCESLNASSRGSQWLTSLLLVCKRSIGLIDMIQARSSLVSWHSYGYCQPYALQMHCLSVSTIGALWCYCGPFGRSLLFSLRSSIQMWVYCIHPVIMHLKHFFIYLNIAASTSNCKFVTKTILEY